MYCSHCAAPLDDQDGFCPACGTRRGGVATVAQPLTRPGIITLLAVLQYIGAAVGALAAIGFILTASSAPTQTARTATILVALLMTAFSIPVFLCGYGLWNLRPYGRKIQIVFAWIGLLGFPIGTIISILILVYLAKPGIKALFSGKPAEALTPQEWTEIGTLSRGSSMATILIVGAVVVVGLVIVVGIIPAIAVPGLLRARVSGNEASAIGTTRAFLSGQFAYMSAKGSFDRPECLVAPAQCGLPAETQPFLDPSFASRFEKSGYLFVYEPGVTTDRPLSSGVTDFSFIATPIVPGGTGERSFCADATGTICSVSDGSLQPEAGRCPSTCQPLF